MQNDAKFFCMISHHFASFRMRFSHGIFKVMLKRAYWPEGVGEACDRSVCPPGCNGLSLLPLLAGVQSAKKILAFHPLYILKLVYCHYLVMFVWRILFELARYIHPQ